MKKLVLATCLMVSIIQSCQTGDEPTTQSKNDAPSSIDAKATADHNAMVNRGKYLVTIAGCHDCHTPKIMTAQGPALDESRLLSGHPANEPIANFNPDILKDWALFSHSLTAAVGPWGVSFAANLTPDDTGIGQWEEEQFIRALREGKFKGLEGGRQLLPPMPWQTISQMTDEDLKSIFAFLKTTKPIVNVVPTSIAPKLASVN